MENKSTKEIKFLSTDLRGYQKYLKSLGFSERHIGFMQLAPRRLFELCGSFACLDILKHQNFRDRFLELIRSQYCDGTLKKYSSGITHFRNYLISNSVIKADSICLKAMRKKGPVRAYYHNNKTKYFEEIEKRYSDYLEIEREYSLNDFEKKIASYEKFASYIISKGLTSFGKVTVKHVIEFRNLESTYKTNWAHFRVFLSFSYREGYIGKDITKVVIKYRSKSSNKRKKYLNPSHIEKLLRALPREDAWEKRDYAMFLLMARMGLRPCETIRIRLSDIDWVNSQIFIRGKDQTEDWLPLHYEVGDAIIDYFQSAPRGESGFLFVKKRPPHSELLNTYSLMQSLKKAYEETGIEPPTGSVRLNVFRHSFATKLVNSDGANFHSVQAMMRHANPEMTLYYAKYHSKKLSLFAKKWPEARS